MKKWVRKAISVALSGALLLGASGMALATQANTDSNSNFNIVTTGADAAANDQTSINLIKDYDAENDFPSPAETVTYKIKPYHVWNAGSTYSSGTATAITAANMPMGFSTAATGSTSAGALNDTGSNIGINREYVVSETLQVGNAKVPTGSDDYLATDNKTAINLPTYDTVGDYWYEVKETIGNTTGVIYGTNDNETPNTASNHNHNATYYLHVQVTQGASSLVRNVTLHKTAPDTTTVLTDADYNSSTFGSTTSDTVNNGDKVNAIENRYHAGELVIKKAVTGNAGDKIEYFPVRVVFRKEAGTIVNSDITFTAALKSTSSGVDTYTDTAVTIKGQYYTSAATTTELKWTETDTSAATATAEFYVKDSSTVTFSNIPYGISYTVSETLPANDTYKNKLEFTSADAATTFDNISLAADTSATTLDATDKSATGAISDATDEITITNDKTMAIDIGVITENAPYMSLMAVCAAAAVLMVTRKKRIFED